MKTALRLTVCVVMAAAAHPVFAQSNKSGDGEANVPFETSTERVEMKRAPLGEELGGGSGEPGRAAAREKAAKEEAAIREHAEREFLKHIWEDP